ncbi:hypothetical protein D1164_06350 [Mariniphaga sediminis]|uniref:LamG-like jellyroll fold domain-containing protein n=1 Tax=Mariniphaga sediminis TaxID=1628158 RepID=A0A399D1W8_9BACT|nr:LamG-like jellyroll fold domain-containing protein [Mariniphaga sediminis]RIH65884.1 hypothetical protein D1164_06350 [Mariniphaga sediminis]
MNVSVKSLIGWHILTLLFIFCFPSTRISAKEFPEASFLITGLSPSGISSQRLWNFLQKDNNTGIETGITEQDGKIILTGTEQSIDILIDRLYDLTRNDSTKIIPVFLNYEGNISLLDSIIGQSKISSRIFYLPRGEAWPPMDYLIQADRRILFFVTGNFENQGRVLHHTQDYIFRVSASGTPEKGMRGNYHAAETNLELFMIDNLDKLPTNTPDGGSIRNLVPDYINFLLENWTRFGKKPNFIFVGESILNFDIIIAQLNSFTWINGTAKSSSGKILEKIYWRNPDVLVTGGRFSFPYRGGEELTLTPFAPGYRMTPEQIIVTGEMEVPENYNIIAHPIRLSEGLTGSFSFNGSIRNILSPSDIFSGGNYSFSRDIERERVLRLPEGANVNLGPPDSYGLRNSSFSVSCFVKFSEILEFGDNAVLGNYETEYRRGLHLILRSGHPYFGLWANDYISEEKLEPNVWYHLVWRYIVETGEQAIFLNGRNIGSSTGHPPFSGTGNIHLGSALSQGASMRGYIDELHIWNRPLGVEEITRLALNEEIKIGNNELSGFFSRNEIKAGAAFLILILILTGIWVIVRRKKPGKIEYPLILPKKNTANQINLFGGFRAVDQEGNDISTLFTPKVKELFLFTLLASLKNSAGAAVTDIDEQLWPDLPAKKVTNNRAVTLNKLRKILQHIEGVEVITQNGFLQVKLGEPLFCDYAEAYNLCQLPAGMDKRQLETFFQLVKKGRFMKGITWSWLDEMRGYTGTQVIDNLLKLAVYFKEGNNLPGIEALAKRILEYDDLNEEAIWLQVWVLRQTNNMHQAKFHFESFCLKYHASLGEKFPMNFEEFNKNYQEQILSAARH